MFGLTQKPINDRLDVRNVNLDNDIMSNVLRRIVVLDFRCIQSLNDEALTLGRTLG